MSWELFTSIVDQFPRIAPRRPAWRRRADDGARAAAHDPLSKGTRTYVLFNTNGTLLSPKRGNELIESGLDELRVSLDAAEPRAFELVRGRDMFDRIVRNVRRSRPCSARRCAEAARLALADRPQGDVGQLPDFVRLARS